MTRRRRPTIEEIKASPNISKEVKQSLNAIPIQDLRPLPLVLWVRKMVHAGRQLNHKDEEIAQWIRV